MLNSRYGLFKYRPAFYMILAFLGVTNAVAANAILIDEDALITEGKKQFVELLKFNQENDRNGCSEDNVYIFSLVSGDDWSKYIKDPVDAEEFLGGTKEELNERLKSFNNNTEFNSDFGMYLCLVSELPVSVAYNFAAGQSLKQVQEKYEAYEKAAPGSDGYLSAQNIAALEAKWKKIIDGVLNGTEEALKNDLNFNDFAGKDHKLLVTQSLMKVTLMDDVGDKNVFKKVLNFSKSKGYFSTHKTKLYDYEKQRLKTRTGPHYKLKNRVLSAIEFVEGHLEDKNLARYKFQIPDQIKIKDAAAQPGSNDYDINDVYLNNLYLFDYTGIYGDASSGEVSADDINQVLSGQLAKSSTKLKVFITDKDVSQARIDMIKGINMLDAAYNNSIVLWMHINEDGLLESTIRIAPDLQNAINAHLDWQRFNELLQDGPSIDLALFTAKQILDLKIKMLYGISEFIITVLEVGTIPPKYYDKTDTTNYNPILKDVISFVMPAMNVTDFVAQEFYNAFAPSYPTIFQGADYDDVQFALLCGLWNGILEELKGVFEVVSMIGYFVDARKEMEVDQMVDIFSNTPFLTLVENMLNGVVTAHSGHPTYVAHQIGKDIVMVATIVIPITKVGSASKITKLAKVINIVDKLNPLTHVFTAAGFVLKKGTGKVINLLRPITSTLTEKIGYFVNGQFIALEQHLYVAAAGTIQALEKIPFRQTAIQTTTGQIISAPLSLMDVLDINTGQILKMIGKASDDAFKASLILSIKSNFNLKSLFNSTKHADEIAERISLLSDAEQLFQNTALKNFLNNNLSKVDRKIFFEDLANIGDTFDDVTKSSWIGNNIDQFNPLTVKSWKVMLSNEVFRRNFPDILVVRDYLTNFPSKLENITNGFRAAVNKRGYLDYLKHVNTSMEDFFTVFRDWEYGNRKWAWSEYFDNLKNKYPQPYEADIDNLISQAPYNTLTRSEAFAVFGYTTIFFYKKLNRWLRQGVNMHLTDPIKKLLNDGLTKMPVVPANTNYYRGLKLKGSDLTKFITEHAQGNTVTYKEFLSVANNKIDSFYDSPDINVKITMETKINSSGRTIHDFSYGKFNLGTSDEGLFMTGSKFEVLDNKHLGGDVYELILKEVN